MEILSKMERKKDHEDKSKAKVQLGRARRLFLGEMLERSGNNPPPALLLNFRLQRRWPVDDPANTPKTSVSCQRAQNFNLDFGKSWWA